MQTRQPPQRTCVACRSTSGKRELVRVVRTPAGSVEVDLTGKKPGRGAYICPQASCWQLVLKKGRLDSALRTSLSADDKLRLAEFATTLEQAVAI
ncbi:MAG: DUF448 domain-containing protein [Dehalococcoidia bacterium]|nr:DUF448 domain-containing protein [Dehalococcoidia bacterium]